MEITGNDAVTAGFAAGAESRSPAKRLVDYAFSLAKRRAGESGLGAC